MKFLERFFTSIIRTILSLKLLLGLSSFAQAQDTLRILAFGDSVTAGYRLSKDEAYPALLQKSLTDQGYKVDVVNAGVSGDTALQGQNRMQWALKRGGPFAVVLLALGANDGLRNSSVEEMRKSLSTIIETFQESGATVYLLGMKLPLNHAPAYRTAFEASYGELAKKYKTKLYPFLLEGVAMNSDYNLQDLIHPNVDGHRIIAQGLEAWLKNDADFKKHLAKSKTTPAVSPKL